MFDAIRQSWTTDLVPLSRLISTIAAGSVVTNAIANTKTAILCKYMLSPKLLRHIAEFYDYSTEIIRCQIRINLDTELADTTLQSFTLQRYILYIRYGFIK
jgi:hypothetical protein